MLAVFAPWKLASKSLPLQSFSFRAKFRFVLSVSSGSCSTGSKIVSNLLLLILIPFEYGSIRWYCPLDHPEDFPQCPAKPRIPAYSSYFHIILKNERIRTLQILRLTSMWDGIVLKRARGNKPITALTLAIWAARMPTYVFLQLLPRQSDENHKKHLCWR